jgi:methylglyoxal synthase
MALRTGNLSAFRAAPIRFCSGMTAPLRIALVAHDHRKEQMTAWALRHASLLAPHTLSATGTTGRRLSEALGRSVHCYLSGPMGGDLQIGAHLAEKQLDALFFFWDPLTAQPHDPDVKALLRVAVLWDIPFACNETSATLLLKALSAQV